LVKSKKRNANKSSNYMFSLLKDNLKVED